MIRMVIHGGAGAVQTPPEKKEECETGLREALAAGYGILETGGSAMDAVQASVMVLEDCSYFNAGRGSVLNRRGRIEMEAGIMDGETRDAGAVTALKRTRNPIALARIVLEKTPHVFLSGSAAEQLARLHELPMESPEYFITEYRRRQWLAAGDTIQMDHMGPPGHPQTVGAVARDATGNLAAATSTGGMTNKLAGRIGDSAVPGAGVFADNRVCAISSTGRGEYFLRTQAAMRVAMLVQYDRRSLPEACEIALAEIAELGGDGGFIAVSADGEIAMPFNTSGMYRAYHGPAGEFISL